MGIPRKDGGAVETDARKIWRKFAENYHLFRGTPTRLWLDQAFADIVRHDGAALGRDRGRLFRPHQRVPRSGRISGRARCSSASRSRSSPPPRARSIRSPRTRRSARPAGRAASSRPTGRTRWSIPNSMASRPISRRSATSPAATRFTWHGYLEAHRHAPRLFQAASARPRPITGIVSAQTADLPQADAERLFAKIVGGAVQRGRCRAVPRADADRDGAHEPRRRAGDADPPRLDAQPQSAALREASAATWAPTSRRARTTCAR